MAESRLLGHSGDGAMRGYFGIGVEGVSKAMNVGSLFRSAHAFGAGFVFLVAPDFSRRLARRADTSDAPAHVPFYSFPDVASMLLPQGCALVGVETLADAESLPRFHHPLAAAYVLGAERGGLSQAMLARCDHVVRIPTRFALNLAVAGSLVMYDRLLVRGRQPRRALTPLDRPVAEAGHVYGGPIFRRMARFRVGDED